MLDDHLTGRTVFSRRTFLKWLVWSGGVLMNGDHLATKPRAAVTRWLIGDRGVEGDIRLLRFYPEVASAVVDLNLNWRHQLLDQDRATPAVGEGAATLYGLAAVASDQLLTKAQEFQRVGVQSEREQLIVDIATYLIHEGLEETRVRYGQQSLEYATMFRHLLSQRGFDGVMATKSIQDLGMTTKLWLWDTRAKRWVGKPVEGGEVPFHMVVLDMATGASFYNQARESYAFGDYWHNGEPVELSWFADISTEILVDARIPTENRPIWCRWQGGQFEDVDIEFTDYSLVPIALNANYEHLGRSVRDLLRSGDLSRSVSTTPLPDRFLIEVDNVPRDVALSMSNIVSWYLAQRGVPLHGEVGLAGFLEQVLAANSDLPFWGFPMGNGAQFALLRAWHRAGISRLTLGTVNQPLDLSRMDAGFLFVSDIPDRLGEPQLLISGLVYTGTSGEKHFCWYKEEQFQDVIWDGGPDIAGFLLDAQGQISWTKQVAIFS
jgi:hypothetical protein